MSRFPRVYAESTIARMNKKLALPQETMSLLYDYFEAFANLYQLLPLKDLQNNQQAKQRLDNLRRVHCIF